FNVVYIYILSIFFYLCNLSEKDNERSQLIKDIIDKHKPNNISDSTKEMIEECIKNRKPISSEVPEINAEKYSDNVVIFNEEYFTICKEYIEYKIIPTPELDNYISNGYKTEEQKNTDRSILLAWIAIVVSFICSIASFVNDIYSNIEGKNDKKHYIESIKAVENEIIKNTKQEIDLEDLFSNINGKLNEIKIKVDKIEGNNK
ncbi:MAG: hypothetical protein RSA01_00575, partial [Clostridium sp.]